MQQTRERNGDIYAYTKHRDHRVVTIMFELFLIDLVPEKRKEFLEAHGCWDADVENPATFPNNWDVTPIMVFDPEEWSQ